MDERRQHPRHDASLEVTFVDEDALRNEMTQNLSRGGCAVVSATPRETEQRVPLTLLHPKGTSLTVIGEVVRVERRKDGQWTLGIQFVDEDGSLAAKVAQFVDSAVGLAPEAPAPEPPAPIDPAAALAAAPALAPDTVLRMAKSGRLTGLPVEALRVVPWVNGRRTVAEIVKSYGQPAEQVTPQLLYLLQHGIIAPGERITGSLDGPAAPRHTPAPRAAPVPRAAEKPAPAASKAAPRSRAGLVGVLVLAAVLVNVWYFVVAPMLAGPMELAPTEYTDVPMQSLELRHGKAYGVVSADWSALPDKRKHVEALAKRFRLSGITSITLTDAHEKKVAAVAGDSIDLY